MPDEPVEAVEEQSMPTNGEPPTEPPDETEPKEASAGVTAKPRAKKARKKKAAKKSPPKKAAGGSQRSAATKKAGPGPPWNFPKKTLEEAIRVAQAIYEKHGGNPVRAEDLARFVGFNKAIDWRFQELLKAANHYGLVSGSGEKVTVSLEPLGEDLLAPSSARDRQQALRKAFRNVDLFREVGDFYDKEGGLPAKLPEDEYIGNILTREFTVPRDRVDTFISVFTANIRFLRAFGIKPASGETREQGDAKKDGMDHPKGDGEDREFFETCFVLMPFGDW